MTDNTDSTATTGGGLPDIKPRMEGRVGFGVEEFRAGDCPGCMSLLRDLKLARDQHSITLQNMQDERIFVRNKIDRLTAELDAWRSGRLQISEDDCDDDAPVERPFFGVLLDQDDDFQTWVWLDTIDDAVDVLMAEREEVTP
jgi:hypothetical protein